MSLRCPNCGRENIHGIVRKGDQAFCTKCYDYTEGKDMAKKKKAAKRKAAKKKASQKAGANSKTDSRGRKMPEVRPCTKCGSTDFENDFRRRAHQGKCNGTPPSGEKAPAKKKSAKKRTASQVGRGSKAKGSKFENAIKKNFSRWWGEPADVVGTKQSAFQRAPGSGGTSPANWPLDIHVPDNFPWAIECKNREGTTHGMEAMERFFTAGTYQVVQWFREAEEELVEAGIEKPLLLVFTRNNYPPFAALRRPGKNNLNVLFDIPHMTLCDEPFGEIVIMCFPQMLGRWLPDSWAQWYAWADDKTYMPRRWEQ